jgi:hypothetical protein
MAEEKSKTILHFTRVKSRGDSSFYDPQSDVRVVLPTAVKMTQDLLMQFVKDPALKQEFSYLAKCYAIYQIRLMEDSTDLVTQVREFEAAMEKVQPAVRAVWYETMFTLMNAVYGLFARRDAKTDGAEIRGMLNTAEIAALASVVSPEEAADINQKLRERGMLYAEHTKVDTNGYAVCVETDEVIKNIKQLAHVFIDHQGSDKWNDLAAACDACFDDPNTAKLDDKTQIAIALAYPSYEHPTLEVEATEDAKPS